MPRPPMSTVVGYKDGSPLTTAELDTAFGLTALQSDMTPAQAAIAALQADFANVPSQNVSFTSELPPLSSTTLPARTARDKLSESKSVLDYGGAGDYAGGGAATGTDNCAPAVLIANNWGPSAVVHFPYTPGHKYRFAGSGDFTTMAACVIDADDGVVFYFDIFPGYNSSFAQIRCVRPIRCVSLDLNYNFVLGANAQKLPVAKSQFLSEAAFDRSSIAAVLTNTSEVQALKVHWSDGDAFTADTAYATPDARTIAFSALTADSYFHMGLRNVVMGDELTACFSGAVATAQFVCMVRAGYGYSGLFFGSDAGTGPVTAFRKNVGAAAQQATILYLGKGTHASYAAYNSHVTIRPTGYNANTGNSSFDILFNGMIVYQGSVNGVICQAGFGLYGQAGVGGTVNSWTIAHNKEPGGYGLVSALIIGDSKTAARNDCWPQYFQEYLEATAGMRVVNLFNYAVSGDSSGIQLGRLTANGVPGTTGGPAAPIPPTICIMDIGTNDVQGLVDPQSVTIANIQAMATYVLAAAPNCKIVLCNFALWYGTLQNGGIGQGAQHYDAGAAYRAAIMRFAAENGYGLIDWHEIIGPVFSGFDNGVASGVSPNLQPNLPPVQDNMHPASWTARLQGFHAARFVAGLFALRPVLAMPWSTLIGSTFSNGWTPFGAQPLRWRTDKEGLVRLSGVLGLGTTTDSTVVATLPRNLWPDATVRALIPLDAGGSARFELSNTDGGLRIFNKTTAGTTNAFMDTFPVYKPANGLP